MALYPPGAGGRKGGRARGRIPSLDGPRGGSLDTYRPGMGQGFAPPAPFPRLTNRLGDSLAAAALAAQPQGTGLGIPHQWESRPPAAQLFIRNDPGDFGQKG